MLENKKEMKNILYFNQINKIIKKYLTLRFVKNEVFFHYIRNCRFIESLRQTSRK